MNGLEMLREEMKKDIPVIDKASNTSSGVSASRQRMKSYFQ